MKATLTRIHSSDNKEFEVETFNSVAAAREYVENEIATLTKGLHLHEFKVRTLKRDYGLELYPNSPHRYTITWHIK